MLEKIKELRVKAECAKALLALADDESEKRHFSKLLDKYVHSFHGHAWGRSPEYGQRK